jgi:uncharacterized alkaline shock family protein YloU
VSITNDHLPASPAKRGVTDIADRVVGRIAGRAASEVEAVLPVPSTGLSRLTGNATDPEVDVDVEGERVRLAIRLAVRYPAPIRSVARQVQEAARSRVEHLTGLEVVAVRVEVVAAPLGRRESRPVV